MASESGHGLQRGLKKLSINPKEANTVADSWEDEAESSGDEAASAVGKRKGLATSTPEAEDSQPFAPPSSPVAPRVSAQQSVADYPPGSKPEWVNQYQAAVEYQRATREQHAPSVRPEKTTGPAARMIASSLGLRPQKRTEEERKYDKAVSEQARKKRDAEIMARKQEEDEREKAKQDIWDM